MNAPLQIKEKVRISANGRMVLPKALRKAVGIEGETELELTVRDGRIEISTIADRVREAQAMFREYVKRDFTSDDFLATRERD